MTQPDDTSTTRAEPGLPESEAPILATIFDAIPDPVIVYDADGTPVRSNTAAVAAFSMNPVGVDRQSLTRTLAIHHLDGRPVSEEELPSSRALRGEMVVGSRFVLTNTRGENMVVEPLASPLIVADRVVGAVSLWHDITERERLLETVQDQSARLQLKNEDLQSQSEELQAQNEELEAQGKEIQRLLGELRKSEARLRLALETSLDGFWINDALGHLTFVNDAYCSMSGYSREELLGMAPSDLDAKIESAKEVAENMAALMAAGKRRFETRHRRKDGRIIDVEASASYIHPGDVFVFFRDITEQRHAAEAVRKPNEELIERATELEAANKELESFAYSVSHDMRAPLRAIDGFSRILLDEYGEALPASAQRYLGLVRSNTQQMGHLIDDLLSFSRLSHQALSRRLTHPRELVLKLLSELDAERQGRDVQVEVGALLPCEVDPALLRDVYQNLLSNAFKYTRRKEPAVIEVGSRREGGENVYYVRDNGVGFDMRYAHKLFGVFQRLHRAEEYEGTGVGLAIVQRIVHRHGGRVWAKGEVDKGATFYFTLEGGTGVN